MKFFSTFKYEQFVKLKFNIKIKSNFEITQQIFFLLKTERKSETKSILDLKRKG